MKSKRASKSSADCQSGVSRIANLRRAKNQATEKKRFVSGIETAVEELNRGEYLTAGELLKQIPMWAARGSQSGRS